MIKLVVVGLVVLAVSCGQKEEPKPTAAQDEPKLESANRVQTATVFVDTRLVDPRYSSTVRIQIDQVRMADLAHLELRTSEGTNLLKGPDGALDVLIILSSDMDKADEDAFVEQVEKMLNQRHAVSAFTIKRSYLPESVVNEIEQEKSQIAKSDFESWRDWTMRLAHEIRLGSFQPEKVDLFFGSLIGQGRTVGSAVYWLSVTGKNKYGMFQAGLAMALNQFFSLFPTQINTWKVEHEIPILKDQPVVQFYNHHPFVKTIAINELTALSMQVVFRYFSYLAQPTSIAKPLSYEFLVPFFAMSSVRTPLGAAEDLGVLTLLKKGYIDRRMAHYLSNFFGTQSLITALLFSAGRLRWLPLALGLEWSGVQSSQYGPFRSSFQQKTIA